MYSQVMPVIIFFSAVISVLYYYGIMQKVIDLIAWIINRVMGTSPPESLVAAANIFLGQVVTSVGNEY